MLINDLISMLEALPRTIAAGWAVWLLAGLLLSVWQRQESRRLVVVPVATKRPKSGVRPPSPSPARPVKSVPVSSGDAFSELEALLDAAPGSHRMPGETSPVLPDASHSAAPVLAAPQSLP